MPARCPGPGPLSLVASWYREVADSIVEVKQIRPLAIVGTRALAYATHLRGQLDPNEGRICLRGRFRATRR